MNKDKKKYILPLIVLVLILISVIWLIVASNKPTVSNVNINKLTDRGWLRASELLEKGGVAWISSENKKNHYIFIANGQTLSKLDYRDCALKVENKKESGERKLTLYLDDLNSLSNKKLPPQYILAKGIRRPIVIYKIKTKDYEKIELIIDGKKNELINITDIQPLVK